MVFSYNWLQSFFKKKLPKPEKLVELLTMKAFEVKEVKKISKDFILDIDILPNRGSDCFSHTGIAREIATLLDLKIKTQNLKLVEDKNLQVKDFVRVKVADKKYCPRYTARVITNVKVAASPRWIQNRLKVCGLRPINNIVDIANYVMLETGQPLHAFDGQKLKDKKIIVRFAKKRERIVTLDEEKYDLNKNILLIADARYPVAIAGIKGGKIPEIDKKTKVVILESANFDPKIIRQGSKKLALKTDASWRFEHGLDPNLTESAINRTAYLIQKIAGGKIAQGVIDFYPKKVLAKKTKLELDYAEKLLGVKISVKEIQNILKRLGFKIYKRSGKSIIVEVPTFRLDISLPEDLIEEIGRIYGFQKIPAIFPLASLVLPQKNEEIFWEDIVKNILKEVGFTEVYNYSFVSEKDKDVFGYKIKDLIELENPVSIEQKYLRPSLILNLLKNVKENFKYLLASHLRSKRWQADFNEIKIFELGKIFKKSKIEKKMLTGIIAKKESKADEFYYLKGVIDLLLNRLGISNIWYDSYKATPEESRLAIWQLRKSAEIKVNGEEIGFLGEISSKLLEEIKIDAKIAVFDLDFGKLTKLASEEQEYQPVSRYPAAVRDIAVLVPQNIIIEEVLNKIEAVSPLIKDVDLFDIYEGEEIPQGKKNLAFHIIYQAKDRTLSSNEIEKIQTKLIEVLEKNPEWEVRK
ncbi:hypothetical protein AMJ49_01555 [Parcubacteria bacterium DG_74_2]|nr:MAG: hypothetical protein AMJ49_01555 [Parcubacteria bacterium DG_74_2]